MKHVIGENALQRPVIALTVFVLLCVLTAGCARPKIYSKWRDHEIDIDGRSDEWKSDLAYYDEGKGINVGVINDDTYLYICLVVRNYGITEQLKKSGFTVWFDPNGGSGKALGIRFPTGERGEDRPGDEYVRRSAGKRPKEPPETFQGPGQIVEVMGRKEERKYATTVEDAGKYGIGVSIGETEGYFVYELKVPLARSEQYPYAVEIVLDRPIGVGFETAGLNKKMMHGPGGGMGSMPGRMMRGPRGRGGGGPGGGMESMSGRENFLQLWATVILAEK